jgi:predicted small secreted protein
MRPRGMPPLSKPLPENPMKRLMAVAMLALFSIATLSACNTMEGLGKDVKKLGEKVEDKASS